MALPDPPEGPDPRKRPPGTPSTDEPNTFGPDAPNVREDDPAQGRAAPEALPSTPPVPPPPDEPIDHGDFAPDET